MLELISASVANLPFDVAELLEPIDIGRFLDADMVMVTAPLAICQVRESKCQSAEHIRRQETITQGVAKKP